MRAFRIGRVLKPWSNLIPPLQGGVYRKSASDSLTTEDLDSDESDWSAADTVVSWSSSTSISNTPEKHATSTKSLRNPRARLGGETAPVSRQPSHVEKPDDSLTWTTLSRSAYTQKLVQNEINEGIQAYPSLDLETQQNIALQYRALHERVKNEGFYTCRYSEYGKDSIRWFVLFAAFVYLLNAKWYLTSAVFLGMFWVCHPDLSNI
jgi:delta8-fatty-acid desaturase